MSCLLLDQTYIYPRIHKKTSSSIVNNKHQQNLPSVQEFLPLRKDQRQKQSYSPMEERKNNSTMKEDIVLLQTIMQGYSIVLDVRIDKRRDACMRLRIIKSNSASLMINNTRSFAMFSMKINQLISCFKQWLVTISVNMFNGQVVIKIPICGYVRNEEVGRTQTFAQMLYKCYVQHYIQLIIFIIKESNSHGATAYDNFSKVKTLENVYRYSQMMHIRSHLNESRLQTEQEKLQKKINRRQDILNICRWSVDEGKAFKMANQLFQMRVSLANLVPKCEKDYQLDYEEMKYIRMLLAMPVQTKPKNPFQNLMVLNHILVNDIQSLRLNKINSGGFSGIYLTDMRYLYVYSSQDHELLHPEQSQSKSSCKLLHKYVIIKREEVNKTNRSHHQMQVLKKIKNGCSIFLPKYYIVINKQNPYTDSVVMDFIPSKNLKEYLIMGGNSISLLTKLYLIFSIVQALRYIRDYRIVHLDIKPNNIMIYCNMLVKLIDFGQSYHPQLPRNKPGYTIPYSSPQIFNHRSAFTSKSDVFSLGVLIFEMLYCTYPFDLFQLTKPVQTAMENYLRKWYMAPQETQTYGEGAVIRILNGIISRCLAVSPQTRPELDWIGLIIKHCFELLH